MSRLTFSEAQHINALQRQALAKINAFKQGGQSSDAMEAIRTEIGRASCRERVLMPV